MRTVIVGAGGQGQVVADILRATPSISPGGVELLGYVDDRCPGPDAIPAGALLGPVSDLAAIRHDAVVVAIGDNAVRSALTATLAAAGERFLTVVHPRAIVSAEARLGDGSMICAGAIVGPGTSIGRGVILNTGCSVDHHCTVGDFSHIAPGVHMGGEVAVGELAFVGIGAVILPRLQVGAGSTVGAGAVVTRDVPPGVTVTGVPARPVRSRLLAGRRIA